MTFGENEVTRISPDSDEPVTHPIRRQRDGSIQIQAGISTRIINYEDDGTFKDGGLEFTRC